MPDRPIDPAGLPPAELAAAVLAEYMADWTPAQRADALSDLRGVTVYAADAAAAVAAEDGAHTCHRPGCATPVPPRMFACRPDWYALPRPLRGAITAAYRPGQETSKDPSRAYLAAAGAARRWYLAQDQASAEQAGR